MVRTLALAVAATVTMVASAMALEPSPAPPAASTDVIGWSSTTWGMTPEEVVASTANVATTLVRPKHRKELDGLVEIKKLAVDKFNFHVQFWFLDGKLQEVELESQNLNDNDKKSLLSLLADKYGVPANDMKDGDARPSNGIQAEWAFPSTTISMVVTSGLIFPSTKVVYRTPIKPLNKL